MADKFSEQLDRMKALMSYGQVNEDTKPVNNYSIEYRSVAADGKTYGIIRECNKFYIKTAPKGKETIAEAYNYIGGWANKTDYEYDSYPKAYKQFEMKMASINEACDAKVNTGELSRFVNQELMTEATESMRNEIARQRQIMYNAGMIMKEAKDYTVKGGDACDNKQPEAETGKKGSEGYTKTEAHPEYEGKATNGVDKKAEPFDKTPGKTEGQLNEELDTDFDAGLKKFGSATNGEADTDHNNDPFNETVNEGEGCPKCGNNPCTCGETDECGKLCEEGEKEWDEGLPGSAGIGEPDTDHNNGPFTQNVNEELEGDDSESDIDTKGEDNSDDTDFDAGLDDEFSDEDSDEDFEDDEDLDGDDYSDDEDFEDEDEDYSDDEDLEDGDYSDDEDFEGEDYSGDEDFEDEVDESDPDSIRMEIERLQGLLADMEGGNDELDGEDELGGEDLEDGDEFGGEDFDDESDFDGEGEEDFPEDGEGDIEECGDYDPLMEAKQRKMNQIIESVVKRVKAESRRKQRVNEDELHVFGKHPGYRKKPMELPQTGEDRNQWGRDWNDESTHTEEPFGKQIGNGDPFTQLVNAVTKDVMYQLKKGLPIEGSNKKKVD